MNPLSGEGLSGVQKKLAMKDFLYGGINMSEFENREDIPSGGGGGIGGGGGGGGTGSGGGYDPPTGTTGGTTGTVTPFPWQQFFPNMTIMGSGNRTQLENALLWIASSTAGMDAAQRNAIFSLVFPSLIPMIQGGGEGFRPNELASLRANAIDTTATQFGGAQSSLKDMLRRRGLFTSGSPMAGGAVRDIALLGSEQAKATSGALRGVDMANAQQRIQNLFNAMNIASGHAADPSNAIQSGASIANALQNEPGGLWRSILGALGGAGASSAGTALGNLINRRWGLGGSVSGSSSGPISTTSGGNQIWNERWPGNWPG